VLYTISQYLGPILRPGVHAVRFSLLLLVTLEDKFIVLYER